MDPGYVVIALVILLASASASTASTKTKALDDRLLEVNPNGARTTRLLRATTEDEERALPGLDNLKAVVNSGVTAVKMRTWLVKKKSGADILAKLKLNEKAEDALASPKLATLDEYLNLLRKKYPASDASLLGTLTAHYGEGVVAAALVSAKNVPDTKLTATKLQTQQLEGWLSSRNTADDVFGILKIKNDGMFFVTSRKIATLEEYIKLFNSNNFRHETDLTRTLINGFGEAKYARLVEMATRGRETSARAAPFRRALFHDWWTRKLKPKSVLGQVLEKNAATAGYLEKAIIGRYRSYYNRKVSITNELPGVVPPRRA
ncbi:putative secreted RxLR effector protein [Phytophthora cinnamomi]|uniref:putative secreted RxLR effector protein n=1 Tax=Phytophthora cinnamomi TaxID=4785 RepID=UPI00355A9CD1|nr:putative secreted RxLR effector protein [Phytophthora cinnamomi]KAG6618852.1 putative secreted RxLR effector protein [Phytophthora cinnamomi]